MTSQRRGEWREHFAGVDVPVPLHGGSTVTGINFDNAASTPPLARVRDMVNRFSDLYSSVHRGTGYKSRLSTEAYEDAREMVSGFLGVDEKSQVVIFVKGTTDALNRIAAEEARLDGRQVLVTEMEHHADLLPWRHRSGHVMVGLSRDGHIDLEAIEYALKNADGRISLVAVCGASNVTGFVSPIHEVAELAHRFGARVSVDAAQLAPHHRIEVRPAGDPGHLDFVSLSGHKMYAPYGAGVLIARRDRHRDVGRHRLDRSPRPRGGRVAQRHRRGRARRRHRNDARARLRRDARRRADARPAAARGPEWHFRRERAGRRRAARSWRATRAGELRRRGSASRPRGCCLESRVGHCRPPWLFLREPLRLPPASYEQGRRGGGGRRGDGGPSESTARSGAREPRAVQHRGRGRPVPRGGQADRPRPHQVDL